VEPPQQFGFAAIPPPFELFYDVIWVIPLFDLPTRLFNREGCLAIVVVNNSFNLFVSLPALDELFHTVEFHSVGRSLPISLDTALILGHNFEIKDPIVVAIDEDDDAFLPVPPMTPGAVKCNDSIVIHMISPVSALIATVLLNWLEELVLDGVKA
jgi:hypothetical protein